MGCVPAYRPSLTNRESGVSEMLISRKALAAIAAACLCAGAAARPAAAAGDAAGAARASPAAAARAPRLASAQPDAQRVSAGCVVVPVDFYETHVRPMLGDRRGVVYVLPETRSVQEMFVGL